MNNILAFIFIFVFLGYANAVTVTDELELRQAIIATAGSSFPTLIEVDAPGGVLIISEELPPISGNIILIPVTQELIIRAAEGYTGPLVTIADRGFAKFGVSDGFKEVFIRSFTNNGDGGAVIVQPFAKFFTNGVKFENIMSNGDGGAVTCEVNSECNFKDTSFTNCDSAASGGAVNCLGECNFNNVSFDGNSAGDFSCAVNAPFGSHVNINQCSIRDVNNHCDTNFFDVNGGDLKISNCHVQTDKNSPFSSCTGQCDLSNNIFEDTPPNKNPSVKTVCNDFGTGAFNSLGYNIDSATGCFLDQATDLVNTNPMLTVDTNGIPQPNMGSPLIESGPVEFTDNILPCPYKDMNGLGRPQDFDGDGVFACDRGPVEVQGGENLSNAQSGLYFDTERNGEGIILEMLSASSALVSMFTYDPNKTDLMWFIGVGNIVGNSVVIDNMQSTSGGIFGAGFDADAIVKNDVGSLSLVFPDCNASDNPGRMVFQSTSPFNQTLENLLVKSNRLSRILSCNQNQANPQSGRSGAFFDPARSGEGVFVQVLDNGSVVVIFYTYSPDGKQFWTLSSDVQITGNTITANMIYPASITGFGSQFNPSEVDLQPWGTLSLEYQPGCNLINLSYASTVDGFGSGNYLYQRLTQTAGTTCDL